MQFVKLTLLFSNVYVMLKVNPNNAVIKTYALMCL